MEKMSDCTAIVGVAIAEDFELCTTPEELDTPIEVFGKGLDLDPGAAIEL